MSVSSSESHVSTLGQRVMMQLWAPLFRLIEDFKVDSYTSWVISVRQGEAPYEIGLVVNQLAASHVRTEDMLGQIEHALAFGFGVTRLRIEPLPGTRGEYSATFYRGQRGVTIHLWVVPNPQAPCWQGRMPQQD